MNGITVESDVHIGRNRHTGTQAGLWPLPSDSSNSSATASSLIRRYWRVLDRTVLSN